MWVFSIGLKEERDETVKESGIDLRAGKNIPSEASEKAGDLLVASMVEGKG